MADQFSQLNLWEQDAKPTVRQQVEGIGTYESNIPEHREKNRNTIWNTWASRGGRMHVYNEDSPEDDDYEPPGVHPVSGLPDRGLYERAEDPNQWLNQKMPYTGLASGRHSPVPDHMTYHGSSKNSWRKHSATEFVPLNQPIHSVQSEVSVDRVHQLMDDREGTSDSRSARGLQRELPRLYRHRDDSLHIIDGNHRITADMLSGRLFTEARVADHSASPQFDRTNKVMQKHKDNAQMRYGTAYYERLNNLFDGRTANGEWTL